MSASETQAIGIFAPLVEAIDQLRASVTEIGVLLAQDAYLNQEQAAAYLGVSVPTFRAWVNAGRIHKLEVEGMVRYSRNLLDRDMLACAVRGGDADDSEVTALLAKVG